MFTDDKGLTILVQTPHLQFKNIYQSYVHLSYEWRDYSFSPPSLICLWIAFIVLKKAHTKEKLFLKGAEKLKD